LIVDEDTFEFGNDGKLKFIGVSPIVSDATTASKGRVRLATVQDQIDQTVGALAVTTEFLIDAPSLTQTDDHGKVLKLNSDGLINAQFLDVEPVFVGT
jgi:hypothetical protein